MKTLLFLLEKEFRQVFRDKAILRMLFIMPVIQLVVLPMAANYEVKDVSVTVVDHDHSDFSRHLIRSIGASGYFKLNRLSHSFQNAALDFNHDEADIVLEIPNGFERKLIRENKAGLFVAVNAINGAKANLGAAYLQTEIMRFNKQILVEHLGIPEENLNQGLNLEHRNWYNQGMNYRMFMVPGILGILLTMVGTFLTALNIVREKEAGTIEQINVTPIRKHIFIIGKLLPFWAMGLIVLGLGLVVARVVYGIVPVGSLFTLFAYSAIFLLAMLGLGLLISTLSKTQQQAMLLAFFLMMIFILMGGLYTSIDSMPGWAKTMTAFNPVRYLIEVMRMVVLKGSTMQDILPQLWKTVGFAVLFIVWAVVSYQKRA